MPIQTLSAENVDANVLHATGSVILDFYQASCPPCRVLEPRLAGLAEQYRDRVVVYRVDIDRDLAIADRFHVRSLPTILVLHGGREVERLDGLITETQLRTAFERSSRARG